MSAPVRRPVDFFYHVANSITTLTSYLVHHPLICGLTLTSNSSKVFLWDCDTHACATMSYIWNFWAANHSRRWIGLSVHINFFVYISLMASFTSVLPFTQTPQFQVDLRYAHLLYFTSAHNSLYPYAFLRT